MRKEYKSPEMELVEMNNNDIITTSGFDNNNLMDEYIDYNNMSDPRINRKKLLKVINNTESLTACKYCNGSCVRSRSIPAAIQKTR